MMVFNNNGCSTLRQLLSPQLANNVFLNGNDEYLIDIKNQIQKINPTININQGKLKCNLTIV